MIVLMPFFNPVPLIRAWCVWEIYCTINGGVLFETAYCHDLDLHF